MGKKEIVCFDFRIIDMGNGVQVIDESVSTPIDSLTLEMQMEYMEVSGQVAFMKRMKRKECRKAGYKQKLARNPFVRFAHFCSAILV